MRLFTLYKAIAAFRLVINKTHSKIIERFISINKKPNSPGSWHTNQHSEAMFWAILLFDDSISPLSASVWSPIIMTYCKPGSCPNSILPLQYFLFPPNRILICFLSPLPANKHWRNKRGGLRLNVE